MGDPYRILITGSRTWDDRDFIWNVLDTLLAELGDVTVVHGACGKGADLIAQGWVRHKMVTDPAARVRAERHPADWQQYGRAAGFRRNAEMIALGADLVLAFIRDNSRGATGCADLAERAGIETRRFEYYSISEEPVWPEGAYSP
jgi:hypothetical protein